jgi:hypothetical protein
MSPELLLINAPRLTDSIHTPNGAPSDAVKGYCDCSSEVVYILELPDAECLCHPSEYQTA